MMFYAIIMYAHNKLDISAPMCEHHTYIHVTGRI